MVTCILLGESRSSSIEEVLILTDHHYWHHIFVYIYVYVYLCGLMKWVVSKFSGEKISPIEVDVVLLSHPNIALVVAFGVPDDKYGEEVHDQLQLSLSLSII